MNPNLKLKKIFFFWWGDPVSDFFIKEWLYVYDHFDLYLTPVTLTNYGPDKSGRTLRPHGRTDARTHAHTPN